jgi:hypothetical protein
MRRLVLAAAIAVLAAGCGATQRSALRTEHAPRTGKVTDLKDIGQLRAAFNAHTGVPRLIVLASPT